MRVTIQIFSHFEAKRHFHNAFGEQRVFPNGLFEFGKKFVCAKHRSDGWKKIKSFQMACFSASGIKYQMQQVEFVK